MTKANNGDTNHENDPALDGDTDWEQATQRLYKPDKDGELTTAVVFAIADVMGVSPDEVKSPPLYETVDVAAIEDAFFGFGSEEGAQEGTGSVEFRYTETLVKVRSDGWIQVFKQTGSEAV